MRLYNTFSQNIAVLLFGTLSIIRCTESISVWPRWASPAGPIARTTTPEMDIIPSSQYQTRQQEQIPQNLSDNQSTTVSMLANTSAGTEAASFSNDHYHYRSVYHQTSSNSPTHHHQRPAYDHLSLASGSHREHHHVQPYPARASIKLPVFYPTVRSNQASALTGGSLSQLQTAPGVLVYAPNNAHNHSHAGQYIANYRPLYHFLNPKQQQTPARPPPNITELAGNGNIVLPDRLQAIQNKLSMLRTSATVPKAERRIFFPFNNLMLSFIAPRLMRYQFDLMMHSVVAELFKKVLMPAFTPGGGADSVGALAGGAPPNSLLSMVGAFLKQRQGHPPTSSLLSKSTSSTLPSASSSPSSHSSSMPSSQLDLKRLLDNAQKLMTIQSMLKAKTDSSHTALSSSGKRPNTGGHNNQSARPGAKSLPAENDTNPKSNNQSDDLDSSNETSPNGPAIKATPLSVHQKAANERESGANERTPTDLNASAVTSQAPIQLSIATKDILSFLQTNFKHLDNNGNNNAPNLSKHSPHHQQQQQQQQQIMTNFDAFNLNDTMQELTKALNSTFWNNNPTTAGTRAPNKPTTSQHESALLSGIDWSHFMKDLKLPSSMTNSKEPDGQNPLAWLKNPFKGVSASPKNSQLLSGMADLKTAPMTFIDTELPNYGNQLLIRDMKDSFIGSGNSNNNNNNSPSDHARFSSSSNNNNNIRKNGPISGLTEINPNHSSVSFSQNAKHEESERANRWNDVLVNMDGKMK